MVRASNHYQWSSAIWLTIDGYETLSARIQPLNPCSPSSINHETLPHIVKHYYRTTHKIRCSTNRHFQPSTHFQPPQNFHMMRFPAQFPTIHHRATIRPWPTIPHPALCPARPSCGFTGAGSRPSADARCRSAFKRSSARSKAWRKALGVELAKWRWR